ncbi:MAG: RnfABCDGE type electron transport complex subunit G [Blautia sp.]|nr:RnfABCDGE type electron transport complex subunit G [Blautia sp.]
MNKILHDTLAITVITLVAGLALGVVQGITKEPIAIQEQKAKEEAYKAVYADADSFEPLLEEENLELEAYLDEQGYPAANINEIMKALDASGNQIGYALNVTTQEGYGGDIQFAMGVTNEGVLNGISILSISETAGLGMRADTDEFKDQFKGKDVEKIEYVKDGADEPHEIDALSGATVTSNAMTNGTNAGLEAYRYELEKGGE